MAYDKEDVYAILGNFKERLDKLEKDTLPAAPSSDKSEYILMAEMFPGGPSEMISTHYANTAQEALDFFKDESGVVYVRVGGQ